MSGNFRNNLQAAILYEGRVRITPSMHLNTFRMAMLNKGIPLHIAQEGPDFVLMRGPDDLQLTCTFFDKPADHAVFSQVLISPVTRMLFPDAQDRVQRHRSHVLVEVQQGVFGGVEDLPDIAAMFKEIGFPQAGRDLASFERRINLLADACTFLQKEVQSSAIHWTQSNTLICGDKVEPFLNMTGPGLLTIHPMLFAGPQEPGMKETPVEIYTIGAADYVGREIHADYAPIPWLDMYDSITAFVRLANMPNGYIIPDGNTFGIETGEFSWAVTHLDGVNQKTVNGQPFFNLKLLYHRKHGYEAPDFKGRSLISGGIAEAAHQLRGPEQDKREQIDDWKRNQELAQRAGGKFQIFRKNEPAEGPVGLAAPASSRLGSLLNRGAGIFGKKKSG